MHALLSLLRAEPASRPPVPASRATEPRHTAPVQSLYVNVRHLLPAIVQKTSLVDLTTPPLDDLIGHRRAIPRLPAIPDLFVYSEPKAHGNGLGASDDDDDDDGAGAAYAERFRPHICVELRYEIVRSFTEFVDASRDGGWDVTKAVAHADPTSPLWAKCTPFNPNVLRQCVPLKREMPVSRGRAPSVPGLFVSVFYKGAPRRSDREMNRHEQEKARLLYEGKLPVDDEVRQAAREGIKSVLFKGDVVVVLLPLSSFAPRQWNGTAGALHAEVAKLPWEWRQLGCVPRLALVGDVLMKENVARLDLFRALLPPTYAGPALTTFPASTLTGRDAVFFVKKLTDIGMAERELDAVQTIARTHFAATLLDPRQSAPCSAAYVEGVQSHRRQQEAAGTSSVLLRDRLNEGQEAAVMGVLFAAHPHLAPTSLRRGHGYGNRSTVPDVVLLEGPPGTGKTQTIATAILNVLCRCPADGLEARVIVCAPSNCAVDEVLLRFVRLVKEAAAADEALKLVLKYLARGALLRIGVRTKIDPEVLAIRPFAYLDDLVKEELAAALEANPHREEWRVRRELQTKLVRQSSVVFTTLGSLHRVAKLAEDISYRAVIVDEASQCTEPAVLQALLVASSSAACVLVGDSKQLQPTILSRESSKLGLQRSLLVRLLACGHRSFLLHTQYRMHPDICAFPNAYFYAGKLETGESVMKRQLAPVGPLAHVTPDATFADKHRFYLLDVRRGQMQRGRGLSSFNREEARAVVQMMRQLRKLLHLSVMEMASQLGIITFYNAQKDVILSCLTPEERRSGLQVASVDSFQGKEKRIILLSCVRTAKGDTSDPGFLAYWNRLNVALTRAKDLLVVVGSAHFLRSMGGGRGYDDIGSIPSERHRLTTLRSTDAEVVQQLEAHDRNPLALFGMFCHAESCEAVYTYGVKESTRRLQ